MFSHRLGGHLGDEGFVLWRETLIPQSAGREAGSDCLKGKGLTQGQREESGERLGSVFWP